MPQKAKQTMKYLLVSRVPFPTKCNYFTSFTVPKHVLHHRSPFPKTCSPPLKPNFPQSFKPLTEAIFNLAEKPPYWGKNLFEVCRLRKGARGKSSFLFFLATANSAGSRNTLARGAAPARADGPSRPGSVSLPGPARLVPED